MSALTKEKVITEGAEIYCERRGNGPLLFLGMVAGCNPEGEFQYVPLGNQGEGKIGTTGRTIWDGLFDAVPDLTNREESIFADTEGNVCTEVVLYC